jgi:hypothetical protein
MPSTRDRDRWLAVIGYEVSTLVDTLNMPAVLNGPLVAAQPLLNALTESRVLHTRNLCEFCCRRTRGRHQA